MSKYTHGTGIALTGVILAAMLASGIEPAHAQHQGHGGPQFGVSAEEAGIIAETRPLDDAVLMTAPGQVALTFPQAVNLVKLVVYTDSREWVDIDFRYNPATATGFTWPIPELAEASYYSVNWAILDQQERLVKGSFHFSFGPGAEPPSVVMAREMMELNQQSMPGIEQMRPVEPGGIRFNNDPAPAFEPPFAPILGQPR